MGVRPGELTGRDCSRPPQSCSLVDQRHSRPRVQDSCALAIGDVDSAVASARARASRGKLSNVRDSGSDPALIVCEDNGLPASLHILRLLTSTLSDRYVTSVRLIHRWVSKYAASLSLQLHRSLECVLPPSSGHPGELRRGLSRNGHSVNRPLISCDSLL